MRVPLAVGTSNFRRLLLILMTIGVGKLSQFVFLLGVSSQLLSQMAVLPVLPRLPILFKKIVIIGVRHWLIRG